MNQDLNKYKFRAECALDASIFFSFFDNEMHDVNIEHDVELPDVYVDFQSELSLSEIKKTLRPFAKSEDLHVVYETLALQKNYTGERNYELA